MLETTQKQSSRLTIDNLNNIPMLSIMENSGTPWYVKDKESQAVYMSKACKEFLILSEHFDYEGQKDEDFPCHGQNCQMNFMHPTEKRKVAHVKRSSFQHLITGKAVIYSRFIAINLGCTTQLAKF